MTNDVYTAHEADLSLHFHLLASAFIKLRQDHSARLAENTALLQQLAHANVQLAHTQLSQNTQSQLNAILAQMHSRLTEAEARLAQMQSRT